MENVVNANVAPMATLAGVPTSAIDEGIQLTLSLLGAVDPSVSDTAAGFRYGFALRNSDGNLVSGSLPTTYAGASTANVVTFTVPDNGTYQIVARILDQQNGSRDYTASIVASNVAPSGVLSGPTAVSQGVPTSYTVTASDVSTVDASTLRYAFGTTLAELAGSYNVATSSNVVSLPLPVLAIKLSLHAYLTKMVARSLYSKPSLSLWP